MKAKLSDLLTQTEESKYFQIYGNSSIEVQYLSLRQLSDLVGILEFPFAIVPADMTLPMLVIRELTNRAVNKNIPIF